ncbi:MAG: tRNA 2-selenouridine(34) synthase MnmH [Bacteroidota bacterium]|nr:tRNA 2-selenouridine(34) synthase MnmH [Bacteroidota bacterium]
MKLKIEEFLALSEKYAVVDVRSPKEFAQAHIPGAHNIALFSNEERAVVGTIYKNSGKESAVLRGLEIVGPKMAGFVKEARKLAVDKKILVHCWRGGMRSGSMAWLFGTIGLEVHILEGGYKAYRTFCREQYVKEYSLIVVGGMTGSGKTDVLKELEKCGEQIIDLEGIAHHKGSAFGAIGQLAQPTTEQFENNLAKEWSKLDFSLPIWIEDESRAVGLVNVPEELYKKIRSTKVFKIDVPKSERIKRLVKEYACFDKESLESAVVRIQKRLGGENKSVAMEALEKNDFATVADITLVYYDKAYNHGLLKRDAETVYELKVEKDNPSDTARKLIDLYNTIV